MMRADDYLDFDVDELYGRDPRNPENHPEPPDPDPDDPYAGDPYAEAEAEPLKPMEWITASDLAGKPVPPREWIVDQWLAVRTVTSLYGGAGFGKSLVAQQLATAVSTGTSFFGLQTQHCKVLGVFAEDDNDELHRRQASICEQGFEMADLTDFAWTARAGEQNALVNESPVAKGVLTWTALFGAIEDRVKQTGARLVILDNIAQLFGANENDRALVTSFVNRLHKLAQEINGAVLLLGHPGKGGVAKEFSGSTAWDAAVRSRWLLRRPEVDEDAEEGEGDYIRELVKAKANYSGIGDVITLEWDRGCFHLLGGTSPGPQTMGEKCEESARHAQVNGLILQALDTLRRQKRHVVLASNQPNAATKALPKLDPFKLARVSRKEVEAGLQRLFDDGRIMNGMAVWQKPNRHWAEGLGRAEWEQPAGRSTSSKAQTEEDNNP